MSKKQKGVFSGKLVLRMLNNHYSYDLGTTKAKEYYGKEFGYDHGYLFSFCRKLFEKSTGIKLKVGEEVLVKITIETTPIKVKK